MSVQIWTAICPEDDSVLGQFWWKGSIYELIWDFEVTCISWSVSFRIKALSRISHSLGLNYVWDSLAGLIQTVSVDIRCSILKNLVRCLENLLYYCNKSFVIKPFLCNIPSF